jgi:hypothetical protein
MVIEREVTIERPIGEVFDFVLDSRNDPRWCPKVKSVELVAGDGPGPGARYAVVHKPVPGRPARDLDLRCGAAERPTRIELTQDDGTDSFDVTYELSELGGGTRLVQRSEANIGAVPRFMYPLWRHGIGRDVARQLRELKKLLDA